MGKNRWNAGTGYRYNEKTLGTQGVKSEELYASKHRISHL
jgi:hypothetical protein